MTWIPRERFLAVVERRLDWRTELRGTNAADRTIRRLRSGEQEFVSPSVADRILTKLDLGDWFHLPKDQGGLADIYEDGAQYGEPNNLAGLRPGNVQRKYATREERLAARRAAYRASYERRKERREAA